MSWSFFPASDYLNSFNAIFTPRILSSPRTVNAPSRVARAPILMVPWAMTKFATDKNKTVARVFLNKLILKLFM